MKQFRTYQYKVRGTVLATEGDSEKMVARPSAMSSTLHVFFGSANYTSGLTEVGKKYPHHQSGQEATLQLTAKLQAILHEMNNLERCMDRLTVRWIRRTTYNPNP